MTRMIVKDVPAQTVLREDRTLTIATVGATAAEVLPRLAAEAEARGLAVTGPTVFAAHGLPQDATTPFAMSLCLPVGACEGTDKGDGGGPGTLPALHAACAVYEGPLAGVFSDGYRPLLAAMADAGFRPTGESREVYLAWEGPEAAGNRIEIQFAIAPVR